MNAADSASAAQDGAGIAPEMRIGWAVRGIVFDFDGTLTAPGALDFTAIRAAVGAPPDLGILEFVESIADSAAREEAEAVLDAAEHQGALDSQPADGAIALLNHARARAIPCAIMTRNSRRGVHAAFESIERFEFDMFTAIISRDDLIERKPLPGPVRAAADSMDLDPADVLVVGDHPEDVLAGAAAGAVTVWIDHAGTGWPSDEVSHRYGKAARDLHPDLVVRSLVQLIPWCRWWQRLPRGKAPQALLDDLIGTLQAGAVPDRSVIVGAGIGLDSATVRFDEPELIVASDPITFATDRPAWWLVAVNANDLAASGGRPRWLVATLLAPVGTTAGRLRREFHDLGRSCTEIGVTVVGGHTEITDAVEGLILVGTMLGTPLRSGTGEDGNRRLDPARCRPGDRLVVTKRSPVEGTMILASLYRQRLIDAGIDREELEAAARYREQILVVEDAALATADPGVVWMHDVTEGGIATAIREVATALSRGMVVDTRAIPLDPLGERVCAALGVDPLGLIGSGSLLIVVRQERVGPVVESLIAHRIPAVEIGVVGESGQPVRTVDDLRLPEFEVDELARISAAP